VLPLALVKQQSTGRKSGARLLNGGVGDRRGVVHVESSTLSRHRIRVMDVISCIR
jgi:hypothetical protein